MVEFLKISKKKTIQFHPKLVLRRMLASLNIVILKIK
jgi:hypothetical protein